MTTPYEMAQDGKKQIMAAILEILRHHPDGMMHATLAKQLGLESTGKNGSQANYLTWSLLGELELAGKVVGQKVGRQNHYRLG